MLEIYCKQVEHPDLAVSITDDNYNHFYRSLNKQLSWNNSEYRSSSDENEYTGVSKISRHLTDKQDCVNQISSKFNLNSFFTFTNLTKHIFFLLCWCLIFCIKLPFHIIFFFIGLLFLIQKAIKTMLKTTYFWPLF